MHLPVHPKQGSPTSRGSRKALFSASVLEQKPRRALLSAPPCFGSTCECIQSKGALQVGRLSSWPLPLQPGPPWFVSTCRCIQSKAPLLVVYIRITILVFQDLCNDGFHKRSHCASSIGFPKSICPMQFGRLKGLCLRLKSSSYHYSHHYRN